MITTYSHSKNLIKGYKNSKIASGEKQDCVVRAMASALDVDYDSAHGLVKSTMNRENNKGTKNYEIVKAMRKFKKEGLEIAGKTFKVDL